MPSSFSHRFARAPKSQAQTRADGRAGATASGRLALAVDNKTLGNCGSTRRLTLCGSSRRVIVGMARPQGQPKERILDIERIVADIKKEKDRISRAIAALQKVGSPGGGEKRSGSPSTVSNKKKRGLTPAGRRRLSLMMKKRWAERRKKGLKKLG